MPHAVVVAPDPRTSGALVVLRGRLQVGVRQWGHRERRRLGREAAAGGGARIVVVVAAVVAAAAANQRRWHLRRHRRRHGAHGWHSAEGRPLEEGASHGCTAWRRRWWRNPADAVALAA